MKTTIRRYGLWMLFLACITLPLAAQDPLRFEKEVNALTLNDPPANQKDVILFTGSSTIRMWKDIQSCFPSHNILNRGFGGSQTSDLLYYFDRLILPYHPKQIFIYEGDNDLGAGKTIAAILNANDSLVMLIHQKIGPKVPVVFITPKPSKARWHLREKYTAYNDALRKWAGTQKNVSALDLWSPMLDKNGVVFQDIFLEDGLHMNKQGYDIWTRTIGPHIR